MAWEQATLCAHCSREVEPGVWLCERCVEERDERRSVALAFDLLERQRGGRACWGCGAELGEVVGYPQACGASSCYAARRALTVPDVLDVLRRRQERLEEP